MYQAVYRGVGHQWGCFECGIAGEQFAQGDEPALLQLQSSYGRPLQLGGSLP